MKFMHEKNRVFLNDENGDMIAEVTFPENEAGLLDIDHTFVDNSLRGQGVAAKLMEEACREIKSQGKAAKLTCPYAVKWFERNQEYQNIVLKK